MVEDAKNFTQYKRETAPVNIWMVGETYCDEGFRIERSESDLMALEFIISGEGTLEIDGQTLHPLENDVFFLRKGSRHRYYADRENPWHKYWVVFDGPVMQACAENYLPKDTYLFHDCNNLQYFQEIFRLSRDIVVYEQMASEITVQLMKIFVSLHNRSFGESQSLAEQLRHRLDASIEKTFSLDLLCEEFNYSKNYLIQVFRAQYGVTPYQYYLNGRVEAAKMLLQNTGMPIGEIAARLAFEDQQYFATRFKRATGYAPMKFRKMFQK